MDIPDTSVNPPDIVRVYELDVCFNSGEFVTPDQSMDLQAALALIVTICPAPLKLLLVK
jgi:hypothetical protein